MQTGPPTHQSRQQPQLKAHRRQGKGLPTFELALLTSNIVLLFALSRGRGCGLWAPARPHLLVGVGLVKAQEQVWDPAVQEQIRSSEGDGEALDGVAEVRREPEVLSVGVDEDVLRKGRTRSDKGRGKAGAPWCRGDKAVEVPNRTTQPFNPLKPGNRQSVVHISNQTTAWPEHIRAQQPKAWLWCKR